MRTRSAITLALVLLTSSCAETSADRIATAREVMRRQVAADISISIEESSVKLYEPGGGFYYVCGISTLNRPGDGPLALNQAQQRFITTVNGTSGGGSTLFDGSSSPEGQAQFQAKWSNKCPSNTNQPVLAAQPATKSETLPSREVAGLTLGQIADLPECEKERSYGYVHYVTFPTNVPCWALPITEQENLTLESKEKISKDGRFRVELGMENVPDGLQPMADIEVINGKIEEIQLETFGSSHQVKILELLKQKWGRPNISNAQDPQSGFSARRREIEAQWLFNDFAIAFIGVMNEPDEGAIIFRSAIATAAIEKRKPQRASSF